MFLRAGMNYTIELSFRSVCCSSNPHEQVQVVLNMTGREKEFEFVCKFKMVSWKFLKKIPSIILKVFKNKVQPIPKSYLFSNALHAFCSCELSGNYTSVITTFKLSKFITQLKILKWHLVFIASGVPSLCVCEAEQKIEKQLWFKKLN